MRLTKNQNLLMTASVALFLCLSGEATADEKTPEPTPEALSFLRRKSGLC